MISIRCFFLFGLVLWVKAAHVVPAEEFDFEDASEEFLENFSGESLRVRREATEKETVDQDSNSAEGRGPRLDSGECTCPPPPPGSHPCHGLSRAACRQKLAPPPYDGAPCELRLLYRLPTAFNMTARRECFEKWEKPALEAKGVDFTKRRQEMHHHHHPRPTLMLNKGCDTQCMFLENQLVVEGEDGAVTISKEAVMAALKEEGDPQEVTDVFEEQINKCMEEAAELVHPKQSCKSGTDEFMGCLRFNLHNACPGGKWKGSKACTDIEDERTKMRDCLREHRSMLVQAMQRFPRGSKDSRF